MTHPNRNYKRAISPPGKAWCADHRDFLPRTNFAKNINSLDGLNTYCKECVRARSKRSLTLHANYRLHVDTARKRGLEPLSREEHRAITSAKCTYGDGCRPKIFVGVDRIDSRRGYPSNSQPCCAFHNNLKAIMDDDLFRIFVKRHREYQECSNSRVVHKARHPKLSLIHSKPSKPQRPLPLFDDLKISG
jgi:hypothetical protein